MFNEVELWEDESFEFKCVCGNTIEGLINEEYNYKETLLCVKCRRKYIVIEITGE